MKQLRKNSKFGIARATVSGWRFAAQNIPFLLKIGAVPLAVHLACNLFILYAHPDASMLEAFLWALPASVFMAWYSFVIVRRIILNETPGVPQQDPSRARHRDYCMRVSVILSLLFNMGLAAMSSALEMIVRSGKIAEGNPAITLLAAVALLFLLWSFRFGALALVAAVDYPLGPFLRRVSGFEFSVRLLGVGLLISLPLVFISELVASPFIENPFDPSESELLFMVLLGSPLALGLTALLTAGVTFALKEMLGNSENNTAT